MHFQKYKAKIKLRSISIPTGFFFFLFFLKTEFSLKKDIKVAKDHGKAQRVARSIDNYSSEIDVCDCCGVPIENRYDFRKLKNFLNNF